LKISNVNTRIYSPIDLKDIKRIIIWYHGGGYALGGLSLKNNILIYALN
jgi:acetyl esterase/lipase